jgi:outer membrane protein assembly factor BamD (BamD/ComL family)
MGRKRAWSGKQIYLYVACLTSLVFFALSCAHLTGNEYLLRSQRLLAEGDFEGALKENQELLSKYPNTPPGDEALFNIGLIYAHDGNPDKDYKKAYSTFLKFTDDFPRSPRFEEAKILTELLNIIEVSRIKIEEQKTVIEEQKSSMEEKKAAIKEQKAIHEYLLRSQRLLSKGDFERALEENQELLSRYPNTPPGDEALFDMGLIYAHYGNPKKDYRKAISFFQKLVEGYPKSSLATQAKIWIEVLQVIEKSKQVDIEIEQMKKELSK